VLYGVGSRLDRRPELFFVLRQVDQGELISSATSGAVSRSRKGGAKRLTTDKLAGVFGIDIIDEAPTARRSSTAPRAAKSSPPRRRKG
jgi:hypothetical protein